MFNDGTRDIFTRAGTFSLDSNGIVVDTVTGNRVPRFGNAGRGMGRIRRFDPWRLFDTSPVGDRSRKRDIECRVARESLGPE